MNAAELSRTQVDKGGDEALFERASQLPYPDLLGRCILATVMVVFTSPMAVTLALGPIWFLYAGVSWSWELLALPLAALQIGFFAALLGILPALLVCAPLWALLLRWQAGSYLSFAAVGALPGLLLMSWENALGVAFLIYGVPASAMCWWLLARWVRSLDL